MKNLCSYGYNVLDMNTNKSFTDKGYNKIKGQNINRYRLGLKGQDYVEKKFLKAGYCLYKRNFKQIGLELDLIVYKVIKDFKNKDFLIIHIIEVKTRNIAFITTDLSCFNIPLKWKKTKTVLFDIVENLKKTLLINCAHKITFDLALVSSDFDSSINMNIFNIRRYIRNVDLLL